MPIKKKFSLAIVDVERIEEINKILENLIFEYDKRQEVLKFLVDSLRTSEFSELFFLFL